MGIVDKAKDALGLNDEDVKSKTDQVSGKASGMAGKAKDAVDKAGDTVDEKTGGKYSGQVDQVQDRAKEEIDKRMPGQ